jgi:hypothetical protein
LDDAKNQAQQRPGQSTRSKGASEAERQAMNHALRKPMASLKLALLAALVIASLTDCEGCDDSDWGNGGVIRGISEVQVVRNH